MGEKNLKGDKGEIYGFETAYREMGYHMVRYDQHAKSLKYFNKAVEKTPTDLRALVGRAKARAKATHLKGALEDIDYALSLYPDEMLPLADKVSNTYLRCEFEEGLVQNTRLFCKRKKPEVFRLGAMNCRAAIENCVGETAGSPLRDHFFVIRNLAWKQNYAAQKPFKPVPKDKPKKKEYYKLVKKKRPRKSIQELALFPKRPKSTKTGSSITESMTSMKTESEPIQKYDQPFPFGPLQRHTTNIENYMAEKYLDKMYLDKMYLKKIFYEPGLCTPNENGVAKLRGIVKQCFKSVNYKQEMLRARQPFYFIKYQEAKVSGALKERQILELQHQQFLTCKEADLLLQKVMEAYKAKRLKDMLDLVEKLKRYCEGKPKRLLPNKASYMKVIFDTVCKAFYETFRINQDQGTFEQNKRIYGILGIPLSRKASTDSVLKQLKNTNFDYKNRIMEFHMRLNKAVVPMEICWLYYELARIHLEAKQFDLARLYAKKCIQEASVHECERWIVNSAMLMCKSNVQQNNKTDAKTDIQRALKSAERLQDKEKIEYFHRCIDVLDTIHFEDHYGMNELEKRERRILEMLGSIKLKDEFAHLFRQMAAMPRDRRMTVMPGVRSSVKKKEDKKSRQMSIMPRAQNRESIEVIKSTLSKEHLNKGKIIMNLLEPHL